MSARVRLATCSLALLLAGCGPGHGDVTGTVTYLKKPVTSGTVIFFGPEGPRTGTIELSGKYTVKDVPAGAHVKAAVASPNPKDALKNPREGKTSTANPDAVGHWFAIPGLYADSINTPLRYDVQAGANVIDIELKEVREEKNQASKKEKDQPSKR